MTQIIVFPRSSNPNVEIPRRGNWEIARRRWTAWIMLALAAAATTICTPVSIAAPAAGDAYVYRLVNGYNHETVAQIRHEVTAETTAQALVVSVTADNPSLRLPRTEIYTPEGQWLRHVLDSHDIAVEYEFSSALPAMPVPLTAGKSWSVRVNARVPGENKIRSVRIDGDVLGNERVRVPAGEFDTVKIRRIIYLGDVEYFRSETRVVEIDWYAPALGRTVRSETTSTWQQQWGCRPGSCTHLGDWNVLELSEVRAATR